MTILVDRGLLPDEAHTRKWRKHNKKTTCDLCAERSEFDPDRESRVDCCIERMVASQPDFLAQKNRLIELLESEGFFVLYIPKFHPELNRTPHSQSNPPSRMPLKSTFQIPRPL